jgi:Putative Ig domain
VPLSNEDGKSKSEQVAAPGRRQLLVGAAAGLAIGAGVVAVGAIAAPESAAAATGGPPYYFPGTAVEGFSSLYGTVTLNNCLACTFSGGYAAVGVVPSPAPSPGVATTITYDVWSPSAGVSITPLYENGTDPYTDLDAVTLAAGWNTVTIPIPSGVTVTLIGFQANEFTGTLLLNNLGWPVAGGNTVTVTNPGSQAMTVGTAVSLQMSATDSASGQTLTYTATGLPAGLSCSSSGLISGTPTAAGTDSVTVTATDTTGARGTATFSSTVSAAPPPGTGLVYMGGYSQGGGNTVAGQWAVAQGVPAAGGFQSVYQWGNSWSGTNSVESVQVSEAEAMAGYPGPCCLNVAMCQSDTETSLSGSLSGSSLTSGCQTAHAATANACLASGVQFIRMAWEFNGGSGYNWMPPFSSYTAAEFKLLWQLIYDVYSSAAVAAGKPANWFKFIFCMVQNDSNGAADMTNYYPGMPYASYITIDEYDRTGGGYTGWAEAINDPPTLTQSVTLALAQGAEGVGFPEWGIRNDAYGPSVIPDPAYINSAFSWMQGVTNQGLNVLAWPWGEGYSGSISGISESSWNFAAWPTMWSALTSNVAAGVSAGWIATTNPI